MIRDRILELRRVPAGQLEPNPRNWRRHPEAQSRAVRAVLEDVGYADALLAREDDGRLVLIDGHLRAETTPDQEVPVLVLDVTEAEADKILATLDPLAAMAEPDPEALRELLEEVEIPSEELARELDRMAEVERSGGRTPADDLPDETPAVTKPGDLWVLGPHRLLCGDSTKPEDVERVMAGRKAALFATDPPFGVRYTGERPSRSKKGGDSGKDWTEKGWHDIPEAEYGTFLRGFTSAAAPHLQDDAAWYIWHAHRHAGLIQQVWRVLDVLDHQQIVWVKPAPMFATAYFNWRHEPCLFGWRRGHRPDWVDAHYAAKVTSVWEVSYDEGRRKQQAEHPTQKPVELFAIPMRIHTHPGDVCFEPFSGSGSQLVAAAQEGRVCCAIELEPRFCDLAVRRWEEFTGEEAVLEEPAGR
ncbi:MAG TPA: DNA modification methylase [Actinomycetota bacterium]|nr:DNA modification methylase [Actinomycetota bacterium]